MNVTLTVMVCVGMLVGVGTFAVVGGLLAGSPTLSAAFERLDGRTASPLPAPRTGTERIGAVIATRFQPNVTTRRLLELQDRSIAEFIGQKAIYALGGALVPGIGATVATVLAGSLPVLPGVFVVVGAVLGWLWPTLSLRQSAAALQADLQETLFSYFDLVTLERLANASSAQALHSAAAVSDAPLFRKLRAAMERGRLEHQPPHRELQHLAVELDLPELTDIADVIRLDEQGAALATVLRARVRELRDQHLTAEKIAASEVSERMTVWMTLPALLFGLFFLTPALLRLAVGS